MSMLTESPERRRIVVIAGISILVLCGVWIIYVLRPTANIRLDNNPKLSSDVLEAQTLSAELKKDERFSHLEITKVDDQTWSCIGEVARTAQIEPAKERAKELKPGVEWKFDIVPINP